ncbi:hypothetical protein HAV15_011112 [Penicillium sp. str. |nr:hypothetical protein HAV15_011112 [Penicillium sp. str. \
MEHRLRAQTWVLQKAQLSHQQTVHQLSAQQKSPNQFYKPIQGTSLLESGRQGVAVSNYGQSLGPMDPTHVGSKPEAVYELSIPVEHTTAAHKLLMWPSIQQLLLLEEYDGEYVMQLVEKRILLSIYAHGEISDTLDSSQLPLNGEFCSKRPDGDSMGLNEDFDVDMLGNVKLDGVTAQRYFESYCNMYKLHPFFDRSELNDKVNRFIQSYCHLNISPNLATDHVRSARDDSPSTKRRRSNQSLSIGSQDTKTFCNSPRPRVD